ncbi:ATP synthase F0 subunit B [Maridesulfovibrio bastinii]|uniref:ATP synthase F0 subunit B n=1 Tax=Maridesulfovibrio bastinii TaxID=47157 RepID=UPI000486ED16|nr:ATP synthase F0 subunit B [Maridesulfovibrio bastinii]
MIDLDYSFLIQLANFLITLMVLNFLMFGPIREIIKRRGELMKGQMGKIEQFTEQADSKMKGYEKALDEARRAGLELRSEFKVQAQEEEQKILSVAGKDAAATMKAARNELSSEKGEAMKALAGQVDEFAQKVTAKVLG